MFVLLCISCSPDGFGDRSRGFLTDEHVASESLQSGVLRDEAEVAMIARVKRAERYILQRVEIIVTGALSFLQNGVDTIKPNFSLLPPCRFAILACRRVTNN